MGGCCIPQGDVVPPRSALPPRFGRATALPPLTCPSRSALRVPASIATARALRSHPPVVARARGAASGALWVRLRPRAPGLVAAGKTYTREQLISRAACHCAAFCCPHAHA